MLDLRYVVENREAVLGMLASRGQTLEQLQAFPGLAGADPWALDGERRALIQEVEQLRHRQRTVGEEIARRGKAKQDASELKAEMKGVAERIKRGEARLDEVKALLEPRLAPLDPLGDTLHLGLELGGVLLRLAAARDLLADRALAVAQLLDLLDQRAPLGVERPRVDPGETREGLDLLERLAAAREHGEHGVTVLDDVAEVQHGEREDSTRVGARPAAC